MKTKKQEYKTHRNKGFTTAEAFVALTIISIVIAASIPMVTVKQNKEQGISTNTTDQAWGVSAVSTGQGLLTDRAVVITNNANVNNPISNSTLSYWIAAPESLLNTIRSERPMFRVGSYDFAQIRDNIFITATSTDGKTNIPNTFDKYPTDAGSLTCFNTANCARNIFLGGTNYNDSSLNTDGSAKTPVNNILKYATTNFNDNTIIGNGNNNIVNNSSGSLIAGFNNNAGGVATTTIIGTSNTATAVNQVIIGNNITPANATDLINIGTNTPLITYNSGDTVNFNRSTIVDGIITAGTITLTSDKRLKNIKGEYKKGLNEVLQVEPIFYTLKSDATNELQVGVIAQDLQKIFPEAVVTMPNGYLGVDVTPVFFATLNALKELNEKTQYEKERTKRLKAEYLALTGGEQKVSFGMKIKNFFKQIKNKLHI